MATIEISTYEYYKEMDTFEKHEMFDLLWDKMSQKQKTEYLSSVSLTLLDLKLKTSKHDTFFDSMFLESLIKIFNSRSSLSLNQIDSFINFSNKL